MNLIFDAIVSFGKENESKIGSFQKKFKTLPHTFNLLRIYKHSKQVERNRESIINRVKVIILFLIENLIHCLYELTPTNEVVQLRKSPLQVDILELIQLYSEFTDVSSNDILPEAISEDFGR